MICWLRRTLLLALAVLSCPDSALPQRTDSRLCAACHPSIWGTYRRTGMGRSFYRPTPANMPEVSPHPKPFYHAPSESYFSVFARGGEFYQRRYQLDLAGQPANLVEKRIDYIMGSGNHARTYLHRTPAGTLIELPLGWYAEKGGYFAMNPGYDRPNHDGFRRPITYDCMFCHNAYPSIPAGNEQPFSPSVYSGPLPEGIDCQRCHGAGARHIQAASTAGTRPEAIRAAIVNPSRLPATRQMELCMSCHLESTSFPLPNALLRYHRGPFSYQPGEPLGDFLINFDHAPGSGREDKYEIVNSAYRLRRSACFLKSNGKLTCTTCHDPHDAPRGETAVRHYNSVCRQCHAPHTESGSCIDCHMPKRRTEDVVHAVATDHLIPRRLPPGDLLADRPERHETGALAYRGPVALYYPESLPPSPENELYLAVAQVKQGSNLAQGISQLRAALEKHQPPRAEFYLELADAYVAGGQVEASLPYYRAAVQRNDHFAHGHQKLGTALRRAGHHREAAQSLERATALAPSSPVAWHELGLVYRALGRETDAIGAIGKAIERDPDLSEAHNNLGILWLSRSEPARAEASFREAIRIKPDAADARGNLANLLAGAGNFAAAREQFDAALRLRPNDAPTRFNYAMLLGRAGRIDDAQRELESALRSDPRFPEAHELLGDLLLAKNQPAPAIPHFRAALLALPDSARSHFGLGAALLSTGDKTAARPHLEKAATDPAFRPRATALLRQLP